MSFEEELQQFAVKAAASMQTEQLALDEEKLQMDARQLELKLKGREISLSLQRASEFVALRGGEYSCPSCWINAGRESVLTSQSSSGDIDAFSCKVCSREFTTSA